MCWCTRSTSWDPLNETPPALQPSKASLWHSPRDWPMHLKLHLDTSFELCQCVGVCACVRLVKKRMWLLTTPCCICIPRWPTQPGWNCKDEPDAPKLQSLHLRHSSSWQSFLFCLQSNHKIKLCCIQRYLLSCFSSGLWLVDVYHCARWSTAVMLQNH